MAKRYKKSSAKCPEPINMMLDLLGAAALGVYGFRQGGSIIDTLVLL